MCTNAINAVHVPYEALTYHDYPFIILRGYFGALST